MLDAAGIRSRLRFDVDRLKAGAGRLEAVDDALASLRRKLEARASALAAEASRSSRADHDGAHVTVWRAQAQASVHLARKAVLREVLSSRSYLSIMAAMAVGRWVDAMRELGSGPAGETGLRIHVEAGRIAYRILVSLRSQRGLKAGAGQLTSAVVVAAFAHAADQADLDVLIEEGLYRGRSAGGVRHDEDILSAASLAIREAAELLEKMARSAEPEVARLVEEAEGLERAVALDLAR